MRSRVKVIVFGTSLYRFTVYPDCIICIPWQTACGKPFYTSTSVSEASLTALRFLLQRSNCMVWYDTCQCNCKSQLQQTSLTSVVGRRLDELSHRHAPCLSFTPQRLGSKPSTWSNAFALAIFIWEKDRQTGPAGAGVPVCPR